MKRSVPDHRRASGMCAAFLLALVWFVLPAAGPVTAKPDVTRLDPHDITIEARPLRGFDNADHARRKFGRLVWRGGVSLTSDSPYIGGFSGLALSPDGHELIAVSDAGFWLTADVTYAEDGTTPKGLSAARVGPLLARSGRRLKSDTEIDAEALTLIRGTPRNGEMLIGFERVHRIGRFRTGPDGLGAPSAYLPLPAYISRLHDNRGIEGVARLAAGRHRGAIVAFAEGRRDIRGHMRGWLLEGRRSHELFLTRKDGFDITDVAAIPDGGLIVLERWFQWLQGVKMRLRHIPARQVRPGAVMKGEVLFEADAGYAIDNMEGLAVHRGADGATVITVISDDNFRFFQRTLLLQFTLQD